MLINHYITVTVTVFSRLMKKNYITVFAYRFSPPGIRIGIVAARMVCDPCSFGHAEIPRQHQRSFIDTAIYRVGSLQRSWF